MRTLVTSYAWVEHHLDQKWTLLNEMNDLSNVLSLVHIYPIEGAVELTYMRFSGASYYLSTGGEFITIANYDGFMTECPYYHEQRMSNAIL